MANMLNPQGQPIQVPDDAVQQVFLGGSAGFARGETVPVTSPDGTPGYVGAEELGKAFQSGYSYDPATVKNAELQARYGTPVEQAKTALESLGSGATLGLSTVAERAMGVQPEDIKGRREANPMTHAAAELTGTVAPLLLTRGKSAEAQAPGIASNLARLVGAPMRGVTEAGEGAEALTRLIAPGGTSALSKMIAATLPETAGSAVQGSLFGLGQVVDEAALHRDGDPELSAEHVLGTIGTNALIGGGIGGATKLVQLGLAKVPFRANMGNAMRRFFGGDAAKEQEFRELLLRQEANAAAEEAANAAPAGLSSEITGTVTPQAGAFRPPDAAGMAGTITQPGILRGEAAAAGETIADDAAAGVQPGTLNAIMRTGAPLDGALPLVTKSNAMQGTWDAMARNPKTTDRIRKAVNATTGGFEDFWDSNLAKIGDAEISHEAIGLSGQRAVTNAAGIADGAQATSEALWRKQMGQNRMIAAPEVLDYLKPFVVTAEKGGPKVPGPFQDLYDALIKNNGMLDLDALRARRTEAMRNGGLGMLIHDADKGQWDGLAGKITDSLQKASQETSPGAANAWRSLNQNWQDWKQKEKVLGRIGNAGDGREAYAAMTQRDAKWLTRWRTLQATLPEEDFGNLLAVHLRDMSVDAKSGRLNLARWLQNWSALQPEERDAMLKLGVPGRQGLDDMLTIARAARDSNYLRNFSNTASAMLFQDQLTGGGTAKIAELLHSPMDLKGKAVTWMVDKLGRRISLGPEDMAKMVTDPGFMGWAFQNPSAQKLADLEHTIQGSESRLKKALERVTDRKFFTRAPLVAAGTEAFRQRDDSPLEAYRRHWGELQKLDGKPEALTNRMMAVTGDLPGVAPETSTLMQSKAADTVQFLADKAPQNPGVDDPTFGRKWEPRDDEILKWARYWDAANDPVGVIEAISRGQLSKEGVETLQTLYPKLYGLTVKMLTEQLTNGAQDRKQPLPYETRQQLSMLLGTPLDPGLQPQRIAASQARFNQSKTAQGGQPSASSGPSGQGQPATGGPGASRPRLSSKFNMADQAQTDTQRLASR